jgi:hypothetical protein
MVDEFQELYEHLALEVFLRRYRGSPHVQQVLYLAT